MALKGCQPSLETDRLKQGLTHLRVESFLFSVRTLTITRSGQKSGHSSVSSTHGLLLTVPLDIMTGSIMAIE